MQPEMRLTVDALTVYKAHINYYDTCNFESVHIIGLRQQVARFAELNTSVCMRAACIDQSSQLGKILLLVVETCNQ